MLIKLACPLIGLLPSFVHASSGPHWCSETKYGNNSPNRVRICAGTCVASDLRNGAELEAVMSDPPPPPSYPIYVVTASWGRI